MSKHNGGEKRKPKKKSVKAKVTYQMNSTRRLSRMGKRVKAGHKGIAANYLSRGQALKKLQITLKDFRRLCILKGIYPRDPKKRPDKKSRADKVYYHLKDVVFLAHEPLLNRFREFKAFMKKVRRAAGRKETDTARRLYAGRPSYAVDHLVKERYPRFADAVADLDDALCLVHLYAALPGDRKVGGTKAAKAARACARLVKEWQLWICRTGALRKVFVSIKGIYFQVEVDGTPVTWVQPHAFTPFLPDDVDFRVMGTFLEFYETFVRFVLFRLYGQRSLQYPPAIGEDALRTGVPLSALSATDEVGAGNRSFSGEAITGVAEVAEEAAPVEAAAPEGGALVAAPGRKDEKKAQQKRLRSLKKKLPEIAKRDDGTGPAPEDDAGQAGDSGDEDAGVGMLAAPLAHAFRSLDSIRDADAALETDDGADATVAVLMKGLKVFLAREVPRQWVEFVLLALGAEVGFDGPGSLFAATDPGITHVVVDRPLVDPAYRDKDNVDLVQPQWIFDSCNAGILVPCAKYAPGAALPPHLSPFVDDDKEGYTPSYAEEIRRLKQRRDATVREAAAVVEPEVPQETGAAPTVTAAPNAADEEPATDDENSNPASQAPKGASDNAMEHQTEAEETQELAKSMMSKKAKRLYDRMQHGNKRRQDKVDKLEEKRRKLEAAA